MLPGPGALFLPRRIGLVELAQLAKSKIDIHKSVKKKALVEQLRAWDANALGWSLPKNLRQTC